MNTILAILLMSSINVADAKPNHNHIRNHRHHNHVKNHRISPAPPPHVRVNGTVFWNKRYWAYPHSNSAFVWRWTQGHYNRQGHWIQGYWRVTLRI